MRDVTGRADLPGRSWAAGRPAAPSGCRAGLLLGLGLVSWGCGRPPEPPLRPNILFLVVDALRADHVGAYGYAQPTTPCLDDLAHRGALFLEARSAANFTRSSVPSLFTGYFPSVHGVVDPDASLHDGFETLAELFASAGYATAAWVPNPSLERRLNFDQGFELYDDDVLDEEAAEEWQRHETARWLNRGALAFLDVHQDRPVFLYLHYRDVHGPYLPPPGYRELFWDDRRLARQESLRPLSAGDLSKMPDYLRLDGAPPFLEFYLAQYDAEIRYTDDRICELLTELDRRGTMERTLLIITADHGESFLEHGVWNHGNELYEEELRVPLLVVDPQGRGGGLRIASPVQGVDLFPTLLALAGLEDHGRHQGRSLVPLLAGEAWLDRVTYAEGKRWVRIAAFEREWKLMRDYRAGAWQLFDLANDPGERRNLFSGSNESARRLGRQLSRFRADGERLAKDFPAGLVPADPRIDAELRALGYLK